MNYIDIFLIVPLLWGAFKGFKKGLIIEVVSLAALGLGIWGGVYFSDYAVNLIIEKVDDKYIPITAFMLTFLAIVLVVYFLGRLLEKIIDIVQLKFINKLAGACFGLLKFGLIISILLFITDRYNQQFNFLPEDFSENSLIYEPLVELPNVLIPAIKNSKLYETNSKIKPKD
ncbi:MAG: CvpA family protein [Flavobacteriales bacterium]|nr:CvpA family protein [Flavobacteriales bacterium]